MNVGAPVSVITPVGPVSVDLPVEAIVNQAIEQAKPTIREEIDLAVARATTSGFVLGATILAAIGVSTWYIASLHKR